jgi:uncharacterized Tic20 family protein
MNNASTSAKNLAIISEVLYLVNLLVLPGIAFLLLFILHHEHANSHPSALARCHLQQTFRTSLWAGFLIIFVTSAIVLLGGFDQPWTWVVMIIYFTCIHSLLVLLGVIGLSRALSGKHFHYPLSSVKCHAV